MKKVFDIAANIAGVVCLELLVVASWHAYQKSNSLLTLAIVFVNGLFLLLYLLRSQPKAVIESPWAWCISFVAVILPFFYRHSDVSLSNSLSILGPYLQVFGLVAIAGSLLCLQTSFGIVPANRGIRHGGLYRIVRHPLYASELLFLLGFTLTNQSIANLVLLIIVIMVQSARIHFEESFLMADPAYKAYMSRTRYRLIPGLL